MSCDAPPCQAQVNFRSGHAVQERVDLVKDKCWKSQVPFDHALVWHSPSSQGPHVSCKGASASAAASHWIGSIGSCFFFCSIKSSSVKLCSSYIYYIYILLLCLLCLFASLPHSLSLSVVWWCAKSSPRALFIGLLDQPSGSVGAWDGRDGKLCKRVLEH